MLTHLNSKRIGSNSANIITILPGDHNLPLLVEDHYHWNHDCKIKWNFSTASFSWVVFTAVVLKMTGRVFKGSAAVCTFFVNFGGLHTVKVYKSSLHANRSNTDQLDSSRCAAWLPILLRFAGHRTQFKWGSARVLPLEVSYALAKKRALLNLGISNDPFWKQQCGQMVRSQQSWGYGAARPSGTYCLHRQHDQQT